MAQFNSMSSFANKYRKLADPHGLVAGAIILAHRDIAIAWDRESKRIMQQRIYNQYIPTKQEYRATKSKNQATRIGRTWRNAGGTSPSTNLVNPDYGKNRAWVRTNTLFQSQVVKADIKGIRMINSARNKRGRQYAAARHNLGTEKSPVSNSIWTKIAEFQTESRKRLQMSGYIGNTYLKYINIALAQG